MKIAEQVKNLPEVGRAVVAEAVAIDREQTRIYGEQAKLNLRRADFLKGLVAPDLWTREECAELLDLGHLPARESTLRPTDTNV